MIKKKYKTAPEKDVLGMYKPTDQLRSSKKKSSLPFLILMLLILMIGAAAAIYFKN